MKYRVGASAFVLSLSLISSNVYADEHKVVEDHSAIELSANVAIVSDYVFRGITQSDENFAIQGEYGGAINNVSYDLGGIYYAYPGADSSLDYDFWEIYGSLGYDFDVASVSVGVNYSPDYFGSSGDSLYTHLGVDVPLPQNFTLSGGVGYQSIDDNATFGVPDYTDWNLTVGYDWEQFNLSLGYYDTDLDEPSECADGCDARIVFAVSASF